MIETFEYIQTSSTSKFWIIKHHTYEQLKHAQLACDRMDKLRNESFNRIKVPNFEYTKKGNEVHIEMQFIKGRYAHVKEEHIIYQDVVLRDSDWSFTDYKIENFMWDVRTGHTYAVDLQSYYEMPKEQRVTRWHQRRKDGSKGAWEKTMYNQYADPNEHNWPVNPKYDNMREIKK